MRLTIERLRTMVLAAGILLIAALMVFLAIGKWRSPLNKKDLPKHLGMNIKQDFSGVTYTQARGGHTLFKIHASKVVQLKQGNALLHDVMIELYGEDGTRVDRITGNEFEYDEQSGIAKAAGPVEITLMRPDVAPAIAPKAKPEEAAKAMPKSGALTAAAKTASRGSIHVKTSGLVFDRDSGMARTDKRVEFRLAQGSGSAVGAVFDSDDGRLVLGRDVELNTERGGASVRLRAQHAEFDRGAKVCQLKDAVTSYQGSEARAEDATILFRDDGSAEQLNATNGFTLTTASGGRLTAPMGSLEFDLHNQPRQGHLEGGVTIDSDAHGRKVHGTSPELDLEFTGDGVLRRARLEKGVRIVSDEETQTRKGLMHTHREWDSPVADVAFRNPGHGQVELATIHGTGGVVVTGESRRGTSAMAPSRMSAAEVTGMFGADSALTGITGVGDAVIEETTPDGTRQTTSGDRLTAEFEPDRGGKQHSGHGSSSEIASATVEGHVVLVQQAKAKPGQAAAAPLRATAERAVYEGAGEWLHLYGNPRVDDGGLQLAANRIDVSQGTGEAFARGNVKATWLGGKTGQAAAAGKNAAGDGIVGLSGQGPAHAIAAEAQLKQETGEATFQGRARLWQDANSIAAPVIVLDRNRETLRAHGAGEAEPVRVVLVGVAGAPGIEEGHSKGPSAPSVIRIRGGDLKYSAAERKVVMRGGTAGEVVAETVEATTVAGEIELDLLPPGNHAGANGAAAQVDRMTARRKVTISAQGRKGTGEQLVYSGDTGEYVLTGTAATPPRLTDPVHGTVTGEALIFNSRDDSVSIEGGGRRTTTETTVPPRHPRQR